MINDRRGFLSIYFFLFFTFIAAAATVGIGYYANLNRVEKAKDIRRFLSTAGDRVSAFYAANGRLPDGTEFRTEITGGQTDPYGTEAYYIYDQNITTKEDVCTTNNTSLTLRKCGDAPCTDIRSETDDILFIIGSRGYNKNKQIGGVNGVDHGIDTYSRIDVDNDTTINRVEEFDDIIIYKTLAEIQGRTECDGSSGLTFMNTILPFPEPEKDYSARIYAKGANYIEWCVEDASGLNPSFIEDDGNIMNESVNCINDYSYGTNWYESDYVEVSVTYVTDNTDYTSDNNDFTVFITHDGTSFNKQIFTVGYEQ
ncbi:hypothetical protein [Limisalsivibrio acetivorans]|uniref:hypothetical protein n=1 Tax=Limisalsivibrio acetivorans TaxID=1304888 RepID=UPI0003B408C2|nr:hypothetical protein [Limisalsivibrio acetivorans]